MNQKKKVRLPVENESKQNDDLAIAGFEEIKTPDADVVSLGSASYTKMLGKIYH